MPIWTPDGEYVLITSGTNLFSRQGDTVLAVPVSTGSEFKPGIPVPLFEGRYLKATLRQLNVVLNWFEELKRLVPPN